MKTLNPLHLIALFFVVLLFLFVKLNEEKAILEDSKETYRETLVLSQNLKDLRELYTDKTGVRKSISNVLKQRSLKSAKIEQSIGASSIKISSRSMDKTALNSLMSKILNGSYNVHSLKIRKLSESRIDLSMEIKW